MERYGGRVLSVLERRLGDHDRAHDLCQEVWIRVHRALQQGGERAERGSFRSWIFAIALNLARDEGRARRRRGRHIETGGFDEVVEVERGASDPLAQRLEQRDAIDAALAAIAEPFRTAVVLVDLEGLSYEEAAGSAGCALGTMKSRVARGRAAFRNEYERVTSDRPRDRQPDSPPDGQEVG